LFINLITSVATGTIVHIKVMSFTLYHYTSIASTCMYIVTNLSGTKRNKKPTNIEKEFAS